MITLRGQPELRVMVFGHHRPAAGWPGAPGVLAATARVAVLAETGNSGLAPAHSICTPGGPCTKVTEPITSACTSAER
jgi:hypothetical protein